MVKQAFKSYETVAFSGLALATIAVALIAPVYIAFILLYTGLAIVFLSIVKNRLAYRQIVVVIFAFFVIVGAYSLQPLYHSGDSSSAKLARLAARISLDDHESLIVFESVGSNLFYPTSMFYSNRPTLAAYTPPRRFINL